MSNKIEEIKNQINSYLNSKNLKFEYEEEETEIGKITHFYQFEPSGTALWTYTDNNFIGFVLHLGKINVLLKEGFTPEQIEKENVWMQMNTVEEFLDILTPNYIERLRNAKPNT